MHTPESIAKRIEEVRTLMHDIHGNHWPQVSAPYREMLVGAMHGSGDTNVLLTALPLAQELDRRGCSPLALLATAGDMASECQTVRPA